jgi:CBS domain containing-hemolysin-like protein
MGGGFLLAVAVMFVIGELVPRALALQFPIPSLTWSSWVVSVFGWLSAPFLAVLDGFSSRLLGAFSINSSVDLNLVDVEAQIRSLMTSGEELPPIAEKLLHNVLDMRKRVAQDILLPRNQIVFLNLEEGIAANLETARTAGHTRFPLCENNLDRCIGLVHIKDIFRSREDPATLDLRRHRREILRFSEDEPVENVLQRMLKKRVHFALVVDEFGGAVGAVTLENVLEELVGDILDEFDKEEALIRFVEEGVYNIDGLAPLHDVCEELGVDLEAEDVSTFGGFITSSLGAMPVVGKPLTIGPLIVTVVSMNERRIISTRVQIAPDKNDEETGEELGGS